MSQATKPQTTTEWASSARPDAELPQTGVTTERERRLSSAFIHIAGDDGDGRAYGTRCSTVVVVEALQGHRSVHVVERTHDPSGREAGMRAERFLLSLRGVRDMAAAPVSAGEARKSSPRGTTESDPSPSARHELHSIPARRLRIRCVVVTDRIRCR